MFLSKLNLKWASSRGSIWLSRPVVSRVISQTVSSSIFRRPICADDSFCPVLIRSTARLARAVRAGPRLTRDGSLVLRPSLPLPSPAILLISGAAGETSRQSFSRWCNTHTHTHTTVNMYTGLVKCPTENISDLPVIGMSSTYIERCIHFSISVFLTLKGDRMLSKSEVIY